jgi:hypothetical protein
VHKREAKLALKTWAKPTIRRLDGGSAELAGSGSVDGSAAFS